MNIHEYFLRSEMIGYNLIQIVSTFDVNVSFDVLE